MPDKKQLSAEEKEYAKYYRAFTRHFNKLFPVDFEELPDIDVLQFYGAGRTAKEGAVELVNDIHDDPSLLY